MGKRIRFDQEIVHKEFAFLKLEAAMLAVQTVPNCSDIAHQHELQVSHGNVLEVLDVDCSVPQRIWAVRRRCLSAEHYAFRGSGAKFLSRWQKAISASRSQASRKPLSRFLFSTKKKRVTEVSSTKERQKSFDAKPAFRRMEVGRRLPVQEDDSLKRRLLDCRPRNQVFETARQSSPQFNYITVKLDES